MVHSGSKVPRWKPGDVITFDKQVQGRSKVVVPMTVVCDRPDLLALYQPSGIVVMRPKVEEGTRHMSLIPETWDTP